MKLPRGTLTASHVVDDPATALGNALDDALTGYLVVEPGSTLLLSADGAGVLTFADGVPVLAYHTGTDNGGADALADLAGPGPLKVDRRVVPPTALARIHDADGHDALAVAPGEPARVLAGAHDLAGRTRTRAPATHPGQDVDDDPLEAFLANDDRIEALRAEARSEATRRAQEWGFTDELDDTDDSAVSDAPGATDAADAPDSQDGASAPGTNDD